MFIVLITKIHLQDVCFSVFSLSNLLSGEWRVGGNQFSQPDLHSSSLEGMFHFNLLSDGIEILFSSLLLFERANPIPVIIYYLG